MYFVPSIDIERLWSSGSAHDTTYFMSSRAIGSLSTNVSAFAVSAFAVSAFAVSAFAVSAFAVSAFAVSAFAVSAFADSAFSELTSSVSTAGSPPPQATVQTASRAKPRNR